MPTKPVCPCAILDGGGLSPRHQRQRAVLADTPNMDRPNGELSRTRR